MSFNFPPASATVIQNPTAIALLHQIQHQVVQVPYQQDWLPILTAAVQHTPHLNSNAPPLLLLHGFDSSLLEFHRLFPKLLHQRELWAIDLYGFGFTEYVDRMPVNPLTIRRHLHQVVTTWIRQPVTLVGASLGGAVAIDFTLHHPSWVRSLILIDSIGLSGSFPLGVMLADPIIDWGVEWLHFRKWVVLTLLEVLPLASSTVQDALRCSLLHHQMPGWKAATVSFTRSGGYGYLSDRICQVQRPTLILWGEADDILGTQDAYQFKQTIPDSVLYWIQQAGHAPHYDQPQQVAELIMSFDKR
jgi:pimeloyl-ACP methyl ester carboxylesterase